MLALGFLGWCVAICAARGRGIGPWPLLWYSVSHTIPGLADVKDDDVATSISLCVRRWFSFQRLLCYALASLAAAAAMGLVQP